MSSRMATVSHSVSDRFPPPSATLDADTDGDLAQVGTGLLVSIGDDEPTKSAPHRDWEGTLTPPELPASEIDQVACWICYGEHLESPGQAWVRPCRCKGTLKYVHESCLLHYIAARAGTATRVCPHCAIEYKLVTPPVTSPVVRMVDHVQKTVHEHRPFVLYTCALLLMLGPAAPALGMADPRWHMRAWAGVRSASKAMLLGTCFGYGRILPLLPAWFAHVAAPLMQEVPGSDWQPPSLATMALALPWISLAWSTAAAYAAGVLLLPRLMRQTPVRDPETESMEWHVEQARSELEIPEFHSLSRAIQKLVLGSGILFAYFSSSRAHLILQ
ncbi:hypothetical protein BC828DRAFT_373092 [Blastocladiella britannica]|nr:hypothetical protein BC828DRAFT_373092 [Blastocladiella britannica]